MELALHPSLSALPLNGSISALLKTARAYLTRGGLSAEEQQAVTQVVEWAEFFGEYILEAKDREDILVRVDTLLEDPAYHRSMKAAAAVSRSPSEEKATTAAGAEGTETEFFEVLGPAAEHHLRQLDRYIDEVGRCIGVLEKWLKPLKLLAKLLTRNSPPAPSPKKERKDPLALLSSPSLPVPLVRGLFASLRFTGLMAAILATALRDRPIDGWLGLAIAELSVEQAREVLALFTAVPGTKISEELVPRHMRLELVPLIKHAMAMHKAYARFNAEADRSDEPIYPSTN